MVAGLANKCIKYILCCFNLYFCIGGAVVVAVALWVRLDNRFATYLERAVAAYSGETVAIRDYYLALYVLVAVGTLLCFTAFLGFCGAICESTCLLVCFFIFLLILFIVELSAGVYILVKRDAFRSDVEVVLSQTLIPRYYEHPDVRSQIDRVQKQLSCCGARGCYDWDQVPESCPTCPADGCVEVIHRELSGKGCVEVIHRELSGKVNIVIAVAVSILGIELVGMVCAMMLCCAIRRKNGDYYY